MKVVLATGAPIFNAQFEKKFGSEMEIVGKPLYREAVEKTLSRTNADVVLLSDELEGVMDMSELILLLRTRHGKARIVYISKKMTPDFKSFLYKYNIYDILNNKTHEDDLRNALYHPKTWEDVSIDIQTLDQFKDEYGTPAINPDELNKIKKTEYTKIKPSVVSTNSLYQEVVSFWSVSDQAAKTFSAANTALFLSANPDLKVLLLDFNIKNPTINLQFGFQDADRNLAALIEDIEDGLALNNKTFEQYLITHPVYPNLKILPGIILSQEEQDPVVYMKLLDTILEMAGSMNFSTILIDTETAFRHPLSIYILRKATKILMHVNESTSALNAVSKMFDPDYGDFVRLLIKRKNLYPVISRATDEYANDFQHNLDAIIDENKTIAIFKENKQIHQSMMEGVPLLSTPNDESYMMFYDIANVIHPGLFKPIKLKNNNGSTSKKISFFGRNKDK